jgi:hypothetical protein
MTGTYSVAKLIASQLNTKWNVTWITPLTVQIFIVLSNPVRKFIAAFIQQKKATLLIKKQQLAVDSQKGNALASNIASLRVATSLLMDPISQFLKVIPLDTLIKEIPEAEVFTGNMVSSVKSYTSYSSNTSMDVLSKISPDLSNFIAEAIGVIPLQISADTIAAITGFSGFDFFQGINNFSDLQSKLDDLEFRAARATAFSTYATAGLASVDTLINKSDIYIDIITTLDTQNL